MLTKHAHPSCSCPLKTATRRPKRRYAVKGKAVRWIKVITTD